MKYTPKQIPDERTIQIMYSQAWNLAVASKELYAGETFEQRQQYFFDQLMKPYEPLLRARAEQEEKLNLKGRKKEIKGSNFEAEDEIQIDQ